MSNPALRAVILAALLGPAAASAQASASVELRVDLPVVLPKLVVVSPGIQVVPEVSEEVFFHGGYYWVRRDAHWWRSRSHRSGWVLVRPDHVPPGLSRIPPGQYKHWKPSKAEKDERKAEKRERKEHRKHEKEHDGHGKGHRK